MPMATGIETWYASPAGSNRMSAPRTNMIAPATESAPCVGTKDSAMKKRGCEGHQQEPGERDRQDLQAVEPEDQRDRADRAREHEPGVPELDDDPDEPDREHERDQVRVDEEVAGALPEAHLDVLDLGSGGLEDEALRHRLHPVDLARAGRGRSAR